MTRSDRFRAAVDWLQLILGAFVMAAAYPMFFIPCGIAPGGFSGIATLIHACTGFPVGVMNLILCVPLFLVSRRTLGRRFFIRSITATALLSVFIDILPFPAVTGNLLIAAIFGGVLLGVGLGLVMRADATTGGSDMAAALLHHRLPHISVGAFVFLIDCIVIVTSGFVFSVEAALVAIVAVFVQSQVLDRIVAGFDRAIAFLILSRDPDTVTKRLLSELERGVTLFEASGGYTGKRRPAVLCVIRRTQTARLRRIVSETDPAAFVIAADVSEVTGEGWTPQK